MCCSRCFEPSSEDRFLFGALVCRERAHATRGALWTPECTSRRPPASAPLCSSGSLALFPGSAEPEPWMHLSCSPGSPARRLIPSFNPWPALGAAQALADAPTVQHRRGRCVNAPALLVRPPSLHSSLGQLVLVEKPLGPLRTPPRSPHRAHHCGLPLQPYKRTPSLALLQIGRAHV